MRVFTTFDELAEAAVGEELGTSEWVEIDPGAGRPVRRGHR